MSHRAAPLFASAVFAAAIFVHPARGNAGIELDTMIAPVVSKAARLEAACADANSDYERSELGCPADDRSDNHALLDD